MTLLSLSLVVPMKAFCEDYSKYYPPGAHLKYMYGTSDLSSLNHFSAPFAGGSIFWGPLHYLEGRGAHGCWRINRPEVGLYKTGRYCLTVSAGRVAELRNVADLFNRAVETRAKAIKKITGVNMENCRVRVTPTNRQAYPVPSVITESTGTPESQECIAFLRVFLELGLHNQMDNYPWNMKIGGEFVRKTATIQTKPDSVIEIGEARKGPVNVTAVRGCDNFIQRIESRKLSEGEVLKGTVKPAEQIKYGTHVCTLDVLWNE